MHGPGENARSWEALGEARPGQSSLSAGALRYRAWAQSWIQAYLDVVGKLRGCEFGESIETVAETLIGSRMRLKQG